MLTLTKKSEYALIGLIHLAEHSGQWVSARSIAGAFRVPLPLLMNVLKDLARGGIVVSERGSKGGYRLAVDPAKLSLADIITCIEGPVHLISCMSGDPKDREDCSMFGDCPIHRPLRRVHDRLRGLLAEVSLADLAHDNVGECNCGCHQAGTARSAMVKVEDLVRC